MITVRQLDFSNCFFVKITFCVKKLEKSIQNGKNS